MPAPRIEVLGLSFLPEPTKTSTSPVLVNLHQTCSGRTKLRFIHRWHPQVAVLTKYSFKWPPRDPYYWNA